MPRNHGPQIKDDARYEALRRTGMSKEKAARIANSPKKQTAKKGGSSPRYEDWSKQDLVGKAREIGMRGYSRLNKAELIDRLRHH